MSPTPITFIVPGQRQTAATRGAGAGAAPASAVPGLGGVVKDSVRVGARRSGGGDTLRLTATPGEDVVVLHISNGPALVLHPETARDLMMAQAGVTRSAGSTRGAGGALADPNEVTVSATLGWQGLENVTAVRGVPRGLLGQVLLQAIDVVGGLIKDPAADFIAAKVVEKVDSQVDAGVYELRPEALQPLKGSTLKRDKLPAAPNGGPLLVFVHGTFVDTASTFGKLWALHPQRVRELFAHYGDRVYALDHPTMGASPIANALTLAKTLPQDAKLHLVTHSRGGVVAEVLARVCGKPRLDAEDFKPFQGAGYEQQRADLQALADIVAARRITVERMVRVACPARGTLLASRRFDAYLSVLKWTLDLAGVPVAPALLDFLGEVAGRRADPTKIPGVAAMMPDSPIVQWLNAADDAVPGQLRVVAGDLEGDSVGSWLKTLLADAFYWTDNDLVVQTRSMYGGTPRERGGASFLLDQGGKVTHFNYFANERTVQAVVTGLTQDAPQGFRTIGPLSWAGEDASGVRGREERGLFGSGKKPADTRPPAEKPAVFVLPGILGSNLKVGDKRVWLSLRIIGGLERLAYAPGVADDVEPDGPIGMIYGDLIEYLSRTHEVIPFAYDWRCPVEEEAQRLGRAVDAALNARNATGQPVRLLAHSMGGVLARTMALECEAVWQRLMAREGARFVMLGTPNGGSWAPMQCLSGDDTFGNTLAAFGKPFQDQEARNIMAAFPGFLQLQGGLTDARLRLDSAATWEDLARRDLATMTEHNWWHRNWLGEGASDIQQNPYKWGVPPQPVLDAAVKLRKRLDAQRETTLKSWANKALLVVGESKFTPQGYEWTDEGLVYLNATDGGDGRVTLDSALLPGVRTWRLGCSHGDLPDEEDAFPAFLELLERGDTAKLRQLERALPTRGAAAEAAAGGAGAVVRSRPSRGRPLQPVPAVTFRSVFQAPADGDADAAPAPASAALRLSVLNGNLMFVQQPLLVGHYRSLALTGTEAVVDRLLGGAMGESLRAGLYPDQSGVPQVFVNHTVDADNPWRLPRPQCAIVVGLGEEGKLDGTELSAAVRQGVIAWAQRVVESPNGAPASFELAATLIGSGGSGVSPGTSARAIAAGVRLANERLASAGWPQVSRLTLVELYLDRAADAWHGLQVLATSAPGLYEVDGCVTHGTGPLRRAIDSDYRGADYDLVTATTQRNVVGDATIGYTLDTRRARTEVRAQTTQGKLLRELVATASNNANRDEQIGRTLFQLLVPIEMEPFLGGTSRMVLELDGGTAGIPWEMLDTPEERRAGSDRRPWAIRSQLLRKLRTADFRERVVDAIADDDVLVIGEPACDLTKYPALPGARAEAQAVAQLFAGPGGVGPERVNALVEGGADARTIINALLARRYRIVHIAGHGEAGEPGQDGRPTRYGGVVLSGDTFLGPHEIQTMRVVPELVFVNCCHLAGRDASQVLATDYDRASFAANVAESLIKIGVRCVVAAGWAVDDLPAKTFATRLYAELLAGKRFVDAVALAREAAWAGGGEGNTWAAYQCYGDPDWQFRPQVGDAQPFGPSLVDEYDGIGSPMGLALALEQLAVASKYQGAKPEAQCERIRHLEARFAARWGGMGAVAEAYAVAYSEAGAQEEAIRWYRSALQANDGSASLRASEQLGNLRARAAYARAKAAAGQKGARREEAIYAARQEIIEARDALRTLLRLQPTIERASLCASASKRLSMLESLAGHPEAAAAALADLATFYREAEDLARDSGHPELFYPALNRMAAELVVRAAEPKPWGFEAAQVEAVRASLLHKATHDPDFWCMVGQVDLDLYDALAAQGLAGVIESLQVRYDDLHQRVAAPRLWASVVDQAEFVLGAVLPHRRGAEQKAVQGLLAALKAYAGRT